jgi:hypothetical protein
VNELSKLTNSLLVRVKELLGNKRLFGYAFVYDGMDYCMVIQQEMKQLFTILKVHSRVGGLKPRPHSSQVTSAPRSKQHSRVTSGYNLSNNNQSKSLLSSGLVD